MPTTAGDLPEWKHLPASDLPASGLEGAPAVISGPNAILVGGVTSIGGVPTVLASSTRANTAPLSPFFQLGLVGATVPGLKIEGEIGQQLGYLNAAGVGTVDFIILLLIGWGFAHGPRHGPSSDEFLRRRLKALNPFAAALIRRPLPATLPPPRPLARLERTRGGPASRHAPRPPCRPPR